MSFTKRIYELMEDLDSLTPQEFESLVIDILKEKGRFTKIESYSASGGKDFGIDIIGDEHDPVTKRETKWLVQVKKRYKPCKNKCQGLFYRSSMHLENTEART